MIIDTNALSAITEGDEAIAERLQQVQRVALPAIVLGEFRFGILGSRNRRAYEEWLTANLDSFTILPIDAITALHYASIRSGLKTRGTPVPENNIWIAALGAQHDLPILTRDRHFTLIEEVGSSSW